MDDLIKTKELIFDAFVELTSALGYENVTVRDIARRVGINVASLYHHFKTKASMLEYAYSFHGEHQYLNRKPIEYMKELIETATAEELVSSIMYSQDVVDQKHFVRMALITKIIYMRIFQDNLARDAFIGTNDNNAEYVTDIIQHGINIGRIDPDFDIVSFCDVLIGAMQSMGIKAFIDVNYRVRHLGQQKRILDTISRILDSAFIK
jgi:AcrR family transcriptional regulator